MPRNTQRQPTAVLALELLGSAGGAPGVALAVVALAVVVVALRRLLPVGTLVGRRGLPAVIGTRGLMSAAFFCAEAYIVFVLCLLYTSPSPRD